MTDDTIQRLTRCFQAVFPNLSTEQAAHARQENVELWDSIAQVTLLAVVEEEFELELPQEGLDTVDSFEAMLTVVRSAVQSRH